MHVGLYPVDLTILSSEYLSCKKFGKFGKFTISSCQFDEMFDPMKRICIKPDFQQNPSYFDLMGNNNEALELEGINETTTIQTS